jgi:hypothetical protein
LSSDFSASPVTVSVAGLDGVMATGRLFRSSPGDPGTHIFGEEIFVGVQNDVIEDLRRESDTVPMVVEPQNLPSEGLIRGPDGLIVARQSAVTIPSP